MPNTPATETREHARNHKAVVPAELNFPMAHEAHEDAAAALE